MNILDIYGPLLTEKKNVKTEIEKILEEQDKRYEESLLKDIKKV
jgi:hypothetical protein